MVTDLGTDFFSNVDRLRLSPQEQPPPATSPAAATSKLSQRRIKGEFIKGPIPLAWLSSAARLPGKAPLAVGLALWFEAGRRRAKEVILTTAILSRFNVGRKAKYKGLIALEDAGLIRVYRKPRRNPVVTVLDDVSPSPGPNHRDVTELGRAASDSGTLFLGDSL
jgi:hypothetical protein